MKNHLFNINKRTLVVALLTISILISCGTSKTVTANIQDYPPKLIFLNYAIKKTENGEKSIQLINKIITDGKLKNNEYVKNVTIGDIECNQLDKNLNLLQRVILKNPLKKTIESLNDSLSFQTKQVELSEATFSIKLKLEPNTEYVFINEILEPKIATSTLIKTKLH